MKVETTKIEGLLILHPSVFGDDRGWFMESFNQQRFAQALEDLNLPVPTFVQDNHSLSQKVCCVVYTIKTRPMHKENWYVLYKVAFGMWL